MLNPKSISVSNPSITKLFNFLSRHFFFFNSKTPLFPERVMYEPSLLAIAILTIIRKSIQPNLQPSLRNRLNGILDSFQINLLIFMRKRLEFFPTRFENRIRRLGRLILTLLLLVFAATSRPMSATWRRAAPSNRAVSFPCTVHWGTGSYTGWSACARTPSRWPSRRQAAFPRKRGARAWWPGTSSTGRSRPATRRTVWRPGPERISGRSGRRWRPGLWTASTVAGWKWSGKAQASRTWTPRSRISSRSWPEKKKQL